MILELALDCFIVVNMVTFMMAGPSDRKQTFNFLSYHLSELRYSVIVKKSSPKNLSADCRPTVGRQTADSR